MTILNTSGEMEVSRACTTFVTVGGERREPSVAAAAAVVTAAATVATAEVAAAVADFSGIGGRILSFFLPFTRADALGVPVVVLVVEAAAATAVVALMVVSAADGRVDGGVCGRGSGSRSGGGFL